MTDAPEADTPADGQVASIPPAEEAPPPWWCLNAGHLAALGLTLLVVFYGRLLPLGPGSTWQALAPTFDGVQPPAAGWLGRALFRAAHAWGASWPGGTSFVSAQAGGAEAVRGLFGLIALALCPLAVWAYARRAGGVSAGAFGLFLLIPAVPMLLGAIQPEALGPLCFLALLALLAGRRPGAASLVAAPLLIALWVNLDVSFLVGLLLLGASALGRLLDARSEGGEWAPALGPLASLLGALALVAVATPDGPGLLASLRAYAASPALATMSFAQPLDFSDARPAHWLFLGSLGVLVLAQAASREGFTPGELLVLSAFAVLALARQGTVSYWLLLFPWLLLPRLAERFGSLPAPEANPRYTAVGVVMAGLILMLAAPWGWLARREARPLSQLLAPGVPWALARQLRAGPDDLAPVSRPLADLLKEAYPSGRLTGTVFATGSSADFLAATLPEGTPVFLWGDPLLAPGARWREYVAVLTVRSDWWEIIDAAGINLFVLDAHRDTALAEALKEDDDWLITPAGEGVLAALRRVPRR